MDKRFIQAHKEARWSFWLAVAYLACWLVTGRMSDNSPGITGLPHWFELSCLAIPVLFIVFCWLMVRSVFRDMPLGDDDEV